MPWLFFNGPGLCERLDLVNGFVAKRLPWAIRLESLYWILAGPIFLHTIPMVSRGGGFGFYFKGLGILQIQVGPSMEVVFVSIGSMG